MYIYRITSFLYSFMGTLSMHKDVHRGAGRAKVNIYLKHSPNFKYEKDDFRTAVTDFIEENLYHG